MVLRVLHTVCYIRPLLPQYPSCAWPMVAVWWATSTVQFVLPLWRLRRKAMVDEKCGISRETNFQPLAVEQLLPLNLGGRVMDFSRPKVMGILNVTDDSFYAGSHCVGEQAIRARVQAIVAEQGDLLDIGACSTRPGSLPVSPADEQARVLQACAIARELAPALPISVDTYRASVAQAAIEQYHVEMINDISGGDMDPEMFPLIVKTQVAYVITHIKGTPRTMQQNPTYDNLMEEVMQFFTARILKLRRQGFANIMVDLGFGFGKTIDHNYELLRNQQVFHELGHPILTGVSRKSMIYKLLGTTPEGALAGTQTVDTIALFHGADMLRVHDVKAAHEAVEIVMRFRQQPIW